MTTATPIPPNTGQMPRNARDSRTASAYSMEIRNKLAGMTMPGHWNSVQIGDRKPSAVRTRIAMIARELGFKVQTSRVNTTMNFRRV